MCFLSLISVARFHPKREDGLPHDNQLQEHVRLDTEGRLPEPLIILLSSDSRTRYWQSTLDILTSHLQAGIHQAARMQ